MITISITVVVTFISLITDEELFEIVNFILSQLKSRTNFKLRVQLLNLLKHLQKESPQVSNYLFAQLMRQISCLQNLISSVTIARHLLFIPRLCALYSWKDLSDESKKSLVEAQATLSLFFAKSKNSSLYNSNYKTLKELLASLDATAFASYLDIVKNLSSSVSTCILWDNVIRFAVESNKPEVFRVHQDIILDGFIKNIVMSKSRIPELFDASAFSNTHSQIDSSAFKDTLFPALQKAILRSAETSLILISFFFEFFTFDLSNVSQGIYRVCNNLKRIHF